jgi:hypothetical protein
MQKKIVQMHLILILCVVDATEVRGLLPHLASSSHKGRYEFHNDGGAALECESDSANTPSNGLARLAGTGTKAEHQEFLSAVAVFELIDLAKGSQTGSPGLVSRLLVGARILAWLPNPTTQMIAATTAG